MYHYTESGLRNVWLRNGYKEHDTPYGKGISIHDTEGLHRAIGVFLVTQKPHLSGAEVRFLRTEMDLSQSDLGRILGVGETTIRGWESGRNKITKPAERLLRSLYKEAVDGQTGVRQLLDMISQMNRDAFLWKKLDFEAADQGWRQAA